MPSGFTHERVHGWKSPALQCRLRAWCRYQSWRHCPQRVRAKQGDYLTGAADGWKDRNSARVSCPVASSLGHHRSSSQPASWRLTQGMSLPSSYTWKAKKKMNWWRTTELFLKNSAENMKKLFRFHLGLLTDEGQSKNRSWQVSEYGWDDWRKWRKEIEDERFVSSLDQHLTFSRKECRDAPLYTLHKLYRSALEECVWASVWEGDVRRGTVRECKYWLWSLKLQMAALTPD